MEGQPLPPPATPLRPPQSDAGPGAPDSGLEVKRFWRRRTVPYVEGRRTQTTNTTADRRRLSLASMAGTERPDPNRRCPESSSRPARCNGALPAQSPQTGPARCVAGRALRVTSAGAIPLPAPRSYRAPIASVTSARSNAPSPRKESPVSARSRSSASSRFSARSS